MATLRTHRLLRIELTVADLALAERFYVDALGFTAGQRGDASPAMAALLAAGRVHQLALHRGGQTLVLQAFRPEGEAYPEGATAADQVFQHFAMPVTDMAAAFARLAPSGAIPISAGPQHLPQRSGGATAYKFRDHAGHPLELIQFKDAAPGGIDHSAIAVLDAERSIAFYRDELGLRIGARQTNTGPEQDRLDGVSGAQVDVVALLPEQPAPHIELLAYHTPPGRPAAPARPRDIAATRLVLEVSGLPDTAAVLEDGSRAALLHDPDGHLLLAIEPRTDRPDRTGA